MRTEDRGSLDARAADRHAALWPATLTGRLIAVLAVFTALASAAVITALYGRGRDLLAAQETARMDDEARGVAARLVQTLAERARTVATLPALDVAQDVAIDDVDKRLASTLARMAGSLGQDAILAVDVNDRIVAASLPELIGRTLPASGWPTPTGCRAPTAARVGGENLAPLVDRIASRARVVFASPIYARSSGVDGRRIGCMLLAADWLALVRASAPPVPLSAIRITGLSSPMLDIPAQTSGDALLGQATVAVIGPPLARVGVAEPRDVALRPLREAQRTAILVAVAVALVTLPAAAFVALGTTRALRRLAAGAMTLDESTAAAGHAVGRPALPAPDATAPTEVRVLHEALEAMLRRQEEANRLIAEREVLASLGTVAAALAHEIRTPLAVVHGSAEMLARDVSSADRRLELTSLITREIARLERLVNDLLAFASPRPTQLLPGDLAAVCRHSLPVIAAFAERQDVRVDARLDSAPARVDAEQLEQVVLNLATNAIQASAPGGVVHVATFTEQNYAILEVRDEGAGIPAEALDRIWTPFFTTRLKGTGLGLAIVKRIVDAHSATIEVSTTAGVGTTVRVALASVDAARADNVGASSGART
jgi:signal transduction histidine kinase